MRKFVGVIVLILVLSSCQVGNDLKYEEAAQQVCNCMESTLKNKNLESIDNKIFLLDYELCMLDIAFDIDPFDAKMGEAIASKCPDLKATHEKYMKDAKK
jgi:hypothetical protein